MTLWQTWPSAASDRTKITNALVGPAYSLVPPVYIHCIYIHVYYIYNTVQITRNLYACFLHSRVINTHQSSTRVRVFALKISSNLRIRVLEYSSSFI